jgi:hypothetical protein
MLQPPTNVVTLHQLTSHYIPEDPHLQLSMYKVESLVWCYTNGRNFMISKYCLFSGLFETMSRESLCTSRHPSLYEHTSYEKQRFIPFFFFKQGTNFRVYNENGPTSKDAQRGLIERPIEKSCVCVCCLDKHDSMSNYETNKSVRGKTHVHR